MKKYHLLVASIALLGLSSCSDFLEEEPKSTLTTKDFYKNEGQARQAVNGAYRNLAGSNVTGYEVREIPNDLLKRATWDEANGLANFTYTASNNYITTMWQGHYAVIKDCNSAIERIEAGKDNIPNWERYLAEARGIRAFLYFDLVRWFGDVPLVLTETKTLADLQVPRAPQAEVFKQIIDDFKYCMEHTMDKGDTSHGY